MKVYVMMHRIIIFTGWPQFWMLLANLRALFLASSTLFSPITIIFPDSKMRHVDEPSWWPSVTTSVLKPFFPSLALVALVCTTLYVGKAARQISCKLSSQPSWTEHTTFLKRISFENILYCQQTMNALLILTYLTVEVGAFPSLAMATCYLDISSQIQNSFWKRH